MRGQAISQFRQQVSSFRRLPGGPIVDSRLRARTMLKTGSMTRAKTLSSSSSSRNLPVCVPAFLANPSSHLPAPSGHNELPCPSGFAGPPTSEETPIPSSFPGSGSGTTITLNVGRCSVTEDFGDNASSQPKVMKHCRRLQRHHRNSR